MKEKVQIYLCSFASDDLKRSVIRFKNQAEEMKIYSGLRVFRFDDLSESKKTQIENFKRKKQIRLFGYACWKPEIILSYLKQIPKNAILQYSDIGCHLSPKGLSRLEEYIRLTKKNDILAFQYKKPNFEELNYKYQIYYEKEYSKGDLFNYFSISLNDQIAQTEQYWSGTVFFKNNEFSEKFLNKWNNVCKKDYLINDENSKIDNHQDFKEHRHDQSVFSILCKLNGITSLSASEIEWAEDHIDKTWKHLKNFPILAKRDKKYNLFTRFIKRQKRNINRLLKK